MAKVKKDESVTENESADKQILGNLLTEFKEEHYNFTETINWWVSTGSLALDVATGGVKPGLWRLCGKNNSGKTPQMLEILRNFLTDVPNSKAIWVIAEGRGLSDENKARCGLKFVTDYNLWEVGTVFVLKSNIFELFIKLVQNLVRNNEKQIRYAFVVDSIDGLIGRDDSQKEITENSKVAGNAMLSKKMMQSLSLGMFQFGHFLGLISQVTSEIKLDPYAKTADRGGNFSGGNSLLHASDVIINYEPTFNGDMILDNPAGKFNDGKTKAIGQDVKITMIKSIKEETKRTVVKYPIKFGRKPSGIWTEREIGDLILSWQLASKAGAGWITFDKTLIDELSTNNFIIPEKIQGFDNMYAIFENNAELTEYLCNKFAKMLMA